MHRRSLPALMRGSALVLCMLFLATGAWSAGQPLKPLAPDEKVAGMSLTEWTVAWSQRDNSLPVTSHRVPESGGDP
jgi:hypothetical protein